MLNQVERDRKQAQLNDQFLNDLDFRLRQLSDAKAMEWETVRSVGEYLNVDRCVWNEINAADGLAIVTQDWYQQTDLPSVVGIYQLSDFAQSDLLNLYYAGQTVVVADVTTNPYTAPFVENYIPHGLHAYVAVPCVIEGTWVAMLVVNAKTARNWRSDEVALLQETVARLWSIIEQTKAVQALRESEIRFRVVADSAPVLIWMNGADGGCEFVNRKYLDFFGKTLEEVQGFGWSPSLHPEDQEKYVSAYLEAFRDRAPFWGQFRAIQAEDGQYRWLESYGVPRFSPAGQFLGHIGSTSDITEIKQAEFALRQTAEKLTETNRLKDEFLAARSHELRTPLNPILGWTTMLKAQKLNPAKTAQALDAIERNARQQIRLIDDLLEVSRVIQGKLSLELCPVDLAQTIQSAIETVQLAAQAKGITIDLQGLSSLALMGDRDRLQQVFWNLLSNAIKFTPNGGRVEVELSTTDACAQIRVTDTGIGVEPEFLPHVFDRFRQADGGNTRKYGGLGLGLSIVRHLVELHGGTVTVESAGIGQGTTFIVKLPIKTEKIVDRAVEPTLNSSESIQPTDLPQTTTALTRTRILLIDDDPDNLDLMRFLLDQDGAIVTAINSPLKAIELILTQQFDLIVSDIGMPELDGYELIQRVRTLPQARSIPALALTAFAYQEDQQKAIRAGFQAYITKPVTPIELLEVLSQLLKH
ncbi:MAG: response regulator [Plectolyngbya sp. WJT66-NPBG17]|jgi:PAS domain S-box-containing protein|nr:response regulator [Plectolyngbya sp. WJT66-NPBG17]